MPSEPASSMYIKNTYSVCIFKTIFHVVYLLLGILIQQLEHLFHQIWNIDQGGSLYLLPPDFNENETGAISPLRLPLIISLEICRIFSSLAMEIPEALSHLNLCVSDNRVIKKKNAVECVYDNLRGCHSLCQGIARPALIARPWSALTLMSIAIPDSTNICYFSSSLSHFISVSS